MKNVLKTLVMCATAGLFLSALAPTPTDTREVAMTKCTREPGPCNMNSDCNEPALDCSSGCPCVNGEQTDAAELLKRKNADKVDVE